MTAEEQKILKKLIEDKEKLKIIKQKNSKNYEILSVKPKKKQDKCNFK